MDTQAAERLDIKRVVVYCPHCLTQHIDRGEWATRRHHTHRCESCGHEWDLGYYSVGVDEADAERRGFLAALEKVANEWHGKEFRYGEQIGCDEVQAFLDTRHVHYPECRKAQQEAPHG
jgi:predicted RNA-binding Zn-ribbon protein involved in translation (DUF1610 family)